jgi:hypothetical protein
MICAHPNPPKAEISDEQSPVFWGVSFPQKKSSLGERKMGCYTLELVHECEAPMLRSVPRAYILTMHDTETFPWLHGVARRTYVQRNRGFRVCAKTRGDGHRVDATNQDLIHAYRSVFAREKGAGASEPVLVFEDDARLTLTARQDLPHVDRFVATRAFSVYTLGSLGPVVPTGIDGHWRFAGSMFACSHAVIYSPRAVRIVLGSTIGPRCHMDGHVIGPMPLKMTFARPVAYQVLDVTNPSENSGTWCVMCDGSTLDVATRKLMFLCVRVLGLRGERGWYSSYTLIKLAVPIVIALCLCFVACAVALLRFVLWKRVDPQPLPH